MQITHSKDGTPLAYDLLGAGPALIYITGATCFRSFWPVRHDAEVFAQAFTVYNYDRRGRGDSSDTLPYAPERELEDIAALIDVAGGSAALFGHSSGAILALEFALRHPGKVHHLSLYDPAYVSDAAERHEFLALGASLAELLEQGKQAEAIRLFLGGIGMPQELLAELEQSPQWATLLALAPTLAYDVQLASAYAPLAQAAQLSVPTQIIVGELSPASIHTVAQQLHQAIPQSMHQILAGQDHLPDPEAVLPLLTDFLKA